MSVELNLFLNTKRLKTTIIYVYFCKFKVFKFNFNSNAKVFFKNIGVSKPVVKRIAKLKNSIQIFSLALQQNRKIKLK
jgi:hypothetical protein